MKTTAFKHLLVRNGCWKVREGANHEIWTGPSGVKEVIGRHTEITNNLATKIMKKLGILDGICFARKNKIV